MIFLHSYPISVVSFFLVQVHLLYYSTYFADGLKIKELNVPFAVQKGRSYELDCFYHLNNNETLYALRWYKDDKEFFRYMPIETPTRRVFNVNGIKINMTWSTSSSVDENNHVQRVMLVNVDQATSGNYRCEVSVEAPSFETDVQEATFSVVEPPIGQPFILTTSRGTLSAAANEPLVANCSGPEGWPAPQLSWTLASKPIPTDEKLITYWVHNGRITGGKLTQATSALRLPAAWIRNFITDNKLEKSQSVDDFTHGSYVILPLRCTSQISGLFEQWDTVDIRVLRYPQTTLAPSVPAIDGNKDGKSNRDIIRSAKSSLTSTAAGTNNTRHGALRNNSSFCFKNCHGICWIAVWTCCSMMVPFISWRASYYFVL